MAKKKPAYWVIHRQESPPLVRTCGHRHDNMWDLLWCHMRLQDNWWDKGDGYHPPNRDWCYARMERIDGKEFSRAEDESLRQAYGDSVFL